MSDFTKNLSNHGIDITFLDGEVTIVDSALPSQERCLPFTVISYLAPSPEEEWNGCACVFPEGRYHSESAACWIIPPYCRHQFLRLDKKHVSTWGHFEFMIGKDLDLMHFYNAPRYVTGEKAGKIRDLLLCCHKNRDTDPVAICAAKGAQYQLLSEVLGCSTLLQGYPEDIFNPFFAGVFQFIRDHLNTHITLDDVAAFAGLSRSSLEKKFRAVVGVSPGEFILRSRLREAAWMLRTTSMTSQEIAEATGFADVYSFSKAFRRKFHRPPIRFRNEKIFS